MVYPQKRVFPGIYAPVVRDCYFSRAKIHIADMTMIIGSVGICN
jgi:hypothetical protein